MTLWSDLNFLNLCHSPHISPGPALRYVFRAMQKGSGVRLLNSKEKTKYKNTLKEKKMWAVGRMERDQGK